MKEDRLREEHVKMTLEYLQQLENMVNNPVYDLAREQQVQINIRVSKDVPPAMFKPDPLNPEGWIANELTYRAMKKDIFALGADLDELIDTYQCTSCKTNLDKQYWHFCPHCGSKFEE
jgi:hypothetical protein